MGTLSRSLGHLSILALWSVLGVGQEFQLVGLVNAQQHFEFFGRKVSLHDNTMVVGAYNTNSTYILNSVDGEVLDHLTDPNPSGTDKFGYSVAVNSDYFLIGDVGHDQLGTIHGIGQAHLYHRATGTWITIDDPTPLAEAQFGDGFVLDGGEFGHSVALQDDLVVVSSPFDAQNGFRAGEAYLFDLQGNLKHTFTDPNPAAEDAYGAYVAVNEHFIAISDHGDDTLGPNRGRVHLYRTTPPFDLVVSLPELGEISGNNFGWDLQFDDEENRLIVGYGGGATIYDLGDSGVVSKRAITMPPGTTYSFGRLVTMSGNRVAIGEQRTNREGKVFIFDDQGNLLQEMRDPSPDHIAEIYPFSIWMRKNQLIVGSPLDDTLSFYSGQAAIYRQPILGDVNVDQVVNTLDVAPFVSHLNEGSFQLEADANQDGAVNILDVEAFVDLLAGG